MLCVLLYSWNIELLKQTEIAGKPVTGQVKSKGNLIYKAEKDLGPMPILMINLSNPAQKVSFANETYNLHEEKQLFYLITSLTDCRPDQTICSSSHLPSECCHKC